MQHVRSYVLKANGKVIDIPGLLQVQKKLALTMWADKVNIPSQKVSISFFFFFELCIWIFFIDDYIYAHH